MTTLRRVSLPPTDPEVLAAAQDAYRSSVLHLLRVEKRWEPRMEEVRASDPFSRLNRSFENETYIARKMIEWGEDLLVIAVRGGLGHPHGEIVYHDNFDGDSKKDAKVILGKLRKTYDLVRAQKRSGEKRSGDV